MDASKPFRSGFLIINISYYFLRLWSRIENMKTENYEDYQKESRKTWGEGVRGIDPLAYQALGLANESGEFVGKIKKIYRDKGGVITEEEVQALVGELGDVLWYLTQICTELGVTLEDVAEANLEKIFSRQARNQLRGEGDNR